MTESQAARGELAADLQIMQDVVREAAALSMTFFQSDVNSWHKEDASPVSDADLAVNDLLHSRLASARPAYGWLSEETEDDPSRLHRERTWVVDPIDGTRAFLKGRDEFTVVVGLVENSVPVAAAITAPARGDVYDAMIGSGARKNGQPISVRPANQIKGLRLLASSGFVSLPIWKTPWPAMEVSDVNSIALRLCLVAEGKFHAAMRLKGCHDWDLAAADLILREAGGALTTHERDPFTYNSEHCTQGSFVAGHTDIHQKLCAHVCANLDFPEGMAS